MGKPKTLNYIQRPIAASVSSPWSRRACNPRAASTTAGALGRPRRKPFCDSTQRSLLPPSLILAPPEARAIENAADEEGG
jgi:uncharacterized protein DUF3648